VSGRCIKGASDRCRKIRGRRSRRSPRMGTRMHRKRSSTDGGRADATACVRKARASSASSCGIFAIVCSGYKPTTRIENNAAQTPRNIDDAIHFTVRTNGESDFL
jgi:hypothetical protein